jgi:hypothetical protein
VGRDKLCVWVLDESVQPPRVVRVYRNERELYAGLPTISAPRGSAAPPVTAFYDQRQLAQGYEFAASSSSSERSIDPRLESHLSRLLGEVAPDEVKKTRKEVLAALRRSADPDRATQGMVDALSAGRSVADALDDALSFGNRRLRFRPEPAVVRLDPAAALVATRIELARAATLARTDRQGRVDALIKPVGAKGAVLVSLAVDAAATGGGQPGSTPAAAADAVLDIEDENATFSSPAQLMNSFLHAIEESVSAAAQATTKEELAALATRPGELADALKWHVHAFAGDGDLGVFLHEMANGVAGVQLSLSTLSFALGRGFEQEQLDPARDNVRDRIAALRDRSQGLLGLLPTAAEAAAPRPDGETVPGAAPAQELLECLQRIAPSAKIETREGKTFVRGVISGVSPAAIAEGLGLSSAPVTVTVDDDGRPVAAVSNVYRSGAWQGGEAVDVSGTRIGTQALVEHHLGRAELVDHPELRALYQRGATRDDLPFDRALPQLLTDYAGPVQSLAELELRLSGRLEPTDVLPPAVVARARSLPTSTHSSVLGEIAVHYPASDTPRAELMVGTFCHVGDPRIAALPEEVAGREATVDIARVDNNGKVRRVETVAVRDLKAQHAAFISRRCNDVVDELTQLVRLEVATGAAALAAEYAVEKGIAYHPEAAAPAQREEVETVAFYGYTQPRRHLGALATALNVLATRPEVAANVSPETRAVMDEARDALRLYDTAAKSILRDGSYQMTTADGVELSWSNLKELRSSYPTPPKGPTRSEAAAQRQETYEAEQARFLAALGEALSVRAGRTLSADEVTAVGEQVMAAASKAPGYAKQIAGQLVEFERRHHAGKVSGPGFL